MGCARYEIFKTWQYRKHCNPWPVCFCRKVLWGFSPVEDSCCSLHALPCPQAGWGQPTSQIHTPAALSRPIHSSSFTPHQFAVNLHVVMFGSLRPVSLFSDVDVCCHLLRDFIVFAVHHHSLKPLILCVLSIHPLFLVTATNSNLELWFNTLNLSPAFVLLHALHNNNLTNTAQYLIAILILEV